MKNILFIILAFCSSTYAADKVTWCSPNPDPVTGEPLCITYTPGIGGIDYNGQD